MKIIKIRYIFSDGINFKTIILPLAAIEAGRLLAEINNMPKTFKQITRDLFAGNKDENDIEIYEGDILKTWHKDFDISHDDDDNEIIVDHLITSVSNFDLISVRHEDWDTWTLGWAIDAGHCFEIIGNIYENPELKEKE